MDRRRTLLFALGAGLLAGAGVWAVGVSKPAPAPPPPPTPAPKAGWLDFTPTAAQEKKMARLRATLKGGERRFPVLERRSAANAPLFMYMAGTSSDDAVVEASLEAIPAAYGARSTKKPLPDRDVGRVLLEHLRSPNPARVSGAIHASRVPLMMEPPDLVVALAVAEAAKSAPRIQRLLALDALNVMRPGSRPPEVLQAFANNLTDDAALTIAALVALADSGPSLDRVSDLNEELRQQARELAESSEPGVRGLALTFLATPTADPEAARLAREHLSDPSGYVRSVAAQSLSKVGTAGDIHELMKLTLDLEEGRLMVEGTPELDGTAGNRQLGVLGRRVVAESALTAIRTLVERALPAAGTADPHAPSQPFPALTISVRRSGDAEVRESAAAIERWYAAEKPRLPAAPRRAATGRSSTPRQSP